MSQQTSDFIPANLEIGHIGTSSYRPPTQPNRDQSTITPYTLIRNTSQPTQNHTLSLPPERPSSSS